MPTPTTTPVHLGRRHRGASSQGSGVGPLNLNRCRFQPSIDAGTVPIDYHVLARMQRRGLMHRTLSTNMYRSRGADAGATLGNFRRRNLRRRDFLRLFSL